MQHYIASAAAIVVGLAWDKAFESLTAPSLLRDVWVRAGSQGVRKSRLNMMKASWHAAASRVYVPCSQSICHAYCLFLSIVVVFF